MVISIQQPHLQEAEAGHLTGSSVRRREWRGSGGWRWLCGGLECSVCGKGSGAEGYGLESSRGACL